MGKESLSLRENWQAYNELRAVSSEKRFHTVMEKLFVNTIYTIRDKPQEFRDIYVDVELDEETLKQIYNPGRKYRHGIIPDYAIDNKKTKKTLYIEVKRQDGWVEGKPSSAGRGNAHERLCKYHTPGLLKIMRAMGKLGAKVLPFLVVFQGDITRDPKRVREITCWFNGYADHFFMWRDTLDPDPLINHFTKLQYLLDKDE